jgi:TonB-linked SusC/RagA family outer membrane protein
MKLKFNGFLVLLVVLVAQLTFAQERSVSGIVSDNAGLPLPGVSVLVKGTKNGTQSDFDGKYTIKATPNQVLIFSYVGMASKEMSASSTNVNARLQDASVQLEGVVVTALGIKREKKSLGYATQQVKGEDLTKVNTGNVANSLSGKVAGVEIRRNGNLGGSTNVVIRGTKSIGGNNQALWVVDGIIMNNDNSNSTSQKTGRGGYDYGNAASDINPDDIESINVLKGGAASALYGSRAGAGVIIVTTKKGKKSTGLGVTVNSGVTMGKVDLKTLPEYQKQYGGGYTSDLDPAINLGSGLYPTVSTQGDASWGAPFDASKLVYQWNSYYPELATYGKATPWVAAKNDANSFFQKSTTLTNSVALAGGNENGNMRLGYTNYNQEGIMVNSQLKRDNFNFSGSYNLSPKTTMSATANYVKLKMKGANETGYNDNIMTSFRQWSQVNVDLKEQENAYNVNHRNITWNPNSSNDLKPAYWDNPYFQRYESYNTQEKNRFYGNFTLNSEITNWFGVTGKASADTYSENQQERLAVGTINNSGIARFTRYDKTFSEMNLDLLLNFKANIIEDLTFRGVLGGNVRRSTMSSVYGETNGGLVVPGIYSFTNSQNAILFPTERYNTIGTNSVFANASFGYLDTFFLDATYRIDRSSTLPQANQKYDYPSVSGTYVFSNNLKTNWLSFGKVRVAYSETGNDADFAQINSVYDKGTSNFGSAPLFSNENSKRNQDLKSEKIIGQEIGLEMQFFKKRFGLEATAYKSKTINNILNVSTPTTSGYSSAAVNVGELQNEGIELVANVIPVKTNDFTWEVKVNWSKNVNKVVSLYQENKSYVIGTFNQGTSLVAEVGEPIGVIKGSGYKYLNGERVVKANGDYEILKNQVIGNINPDWMGGINNAFTYKNITFSFLIDVKQGGDIFSLDQAYGQNSGLYQNTVGTNHLGNPIRNTIANGGGQILSGVQADGSVNKVVAAVTDDSDGSGRLGYGSFPMQSFVYDASFVKLREVSLAYRFPTKYLKGTGLNDVVFTANGSNLWIISKNLPYADPEGGFSSGNFQGFQSGAMPATKDISLSIKLQF